MAHRTIDLQLRWAEAARLIRQYDDESAIARVLDECAMQLSLSVEEDFGQECTLEVASCLTRASKSKLRSAKWLEKLARKGTNGRWSYWVNKLWQI